ncbi:MAG: helix-turn-helix transcriptional regulator [Deltaproteobacteria bacterium]|nr:helix-turn-helix transcriptional regulator [Deltaproteobacteria bacterium]
MTRTAPPPTSLRLHGDVIRRLRESKGLTQLYVAEVVGVTVDTVSRWENNRTSTVKRDNAQALAQALEVALEDILRDDEPATDAAAPGPTPPRPRRRVVAASVTVLAVIGLVVWALWPPPPVRVQAGRRLPAYAPPGAVVPVVVWLRSEGSSPQRVILREQLPPGWSLVSSTTPPDAGPTPAGLVRWILTAGPAVSRLAYLVRAPADRPTGTAYRVRGEIVTPGRRGKPMTLGGDTRIDVEWVHWADENGDFQVSDTELLDALERLEAARALGVDAAEVRALWNAGSYRWDEKGERFVPGPAP